MFCFSFFCFLKEYILWCIAIFWCRVILLQFFLSKVFLKMAPVHPMAVNFKYLNEYEIANLILAAAHVENCFF